MGHRKSATRATDGEFHIIISPHPVLPKFPITYSEVNIAWTIAHLPVTSPDYSTCCSTCRWSQRVGVNWRAVKRLDRPELDTGHLCPSQSCSSRLRTCQFHSSLGTQGAWGAEKEERFVAVVKKEVVKLFSLKLPRCTFKSYGPSRFYVGLWERHANTLDEGDKSYPFGVRFALLPSLFPSLTLCHYHFFCSLKSLGKAGLKADSLNGYQH